ncbi:MAG: 6-bladed beta-propeller [Sulfurimonas sp.]
MKNFLYVLVFVVLTEASYAAEGVKLVWPPPPDEAKIEFVSSIHNSNDLGIKKSFFSKAFDFLFGEEERSLQAPFGIHAHDDRVYTTDIATRSLYVFDKKKNKMITINSSKKEQFLYPIDVVTDESGNIYISDSVRAKIYIFDEDGDYKYSIAPKMLQRPVGIAISKDKKLYIVDALSSQIHVTSLKGDYLGSIGKNGSGDGEFNRPTFIDIGSDGKLYVSDSMNHRVQILSSDGEFIDKFGQLGQEIGSFGSPRGISLDSYNNIYVSDTMFNNIQIFNQNKELLMVLGHHGNRRGEFALAEDISITKDNMIYVADTNNNRIQLFKLINSAQIRSSK